MVRWDPWRALDERGHVTLAWRVLPDETGGAALVRHGGRAVVFLDPRLTSAERTAALAHELVHDERGGGPDRADAPTSWRTVVAAEERRVDLEVARRLVPLGELIDASRAAEDLGHHVTATELAAEHEVPVEIAELACALLLERDELPRDPGEGEDRRRAV